MKNINSDWTSQWQKFWKFGLEIYDSYDEHPKEYEKIESMPEDTANITKAGKYK